MFNTHTVIGWIVFSHYLLLYGNSFMVKHQINDNNVVTTMCDDKFFNHLCHYNGTFYIKFEHNLYIIKINECLVAKNLLTNVTKTNKHSNVTTFVHALLCILSRIKSLNNLFRNVLRFRRVVVVLNF